MYGNRQRPEHGGPISISCRFVATDQWLRTHVDPSWTVFELKRHLLARCVGGVPLAPGIVPTGPRLLVPSPQGLLTLSGLIRPPQQSTIKTGGRPSTAPHATGDDHLRRKPRLSVKVVPSLAKPSPRNVAIHPPGMFGAPTMAATGPQPPPPIYFPSRNPLSSPELSPAHFVSVPSVEDDSPPSSPNMQPDTMSTSSRSTVALAYSQPQSHTTSPTFSTGVSPPSRPFSPSGLPQPIESQPLFSAGSDPSILFAEFTATTPSVASLRVQSTPPVVRPMSNPPSPYYSKPPTPLTSRPPFPQQVFPPPPISPPATSPPAAARSPPLSSSLTSRFETSRIESGLQLSRSESNVDSLQESAASDATQSPLLSLVEFFELESEPDLSHDPEMRSPSPPDPSKSDAHGPSRYSGSGVGVGYTSRGNTSYHDRDMREVREQRERSSLVDEFRLVSFAQGCVLDEHTTVADMRIRPGELLEIQRMNAVVHLGRPTYTQPYFEAPVYLLKRVPTTNQPRAHSGHHHHSHTPRPHQYHIQPQRDYAHHPLPRPPPPPHNEFQVTSLSSPLSPTEPASSTSTRVRSRTVTARDAYGYDGMADKWDQDPDAEQEGAELELSGLEGVGLGAGGNENRGRGPAWAEGPPAARPPEVPEKVEWKLRWLTMREGRLSLSRSRAKQGQPQFVRPWGALYSAQQLPAVPLMGSLPQRYISVRFTGASRKTHERERDEEIGLRVMDGAAHAHLFRVLLRIINTPGTHTILNTDTPRIASAPLASQYPEWRQYIVQRAWLAGRGSSLMQGDMAAGPWMRAPWTAWTHQEAQAFSDDEDTGESDDGDGDGTSYGADESYIRESYGFEVGDLERYDHGLRDSDSEIEWDVEGWRAWESESAFGTWGASNSWLQHRVESLGSGRPRSRSLAAPSSRSSSLQLSQTSPQQGLHSLHPVYPHPNSHQYQQYPPHDKLLSPVSTSSDLSTTSPNTRRARSSTIAGPTQPESPASSTWSPTLAPGVRRSLTTSATGIETILYAPGSNASDTGSQGGGVMSRRSSNQTRSTQTQGDRRGSTTSLEMQRALPPSRRAVTSPALGTKFP